MLKKRNRLTRRDFECLLKQGRRTRGVHLTIVYRSTARPAKVLPSSQSPLSGVRCGVVVSKKTARQASARNKLRRSIFTALGEALAFHHDLHIAVLTHPTAATLTKKALTDELTTVLHRAVGGV